MLHAQRRKLRARGSNRMGSRVNGFVGKSLHKGEPGEEVEEKEGNQDSKRNLGSFAPVFVDGANYSCFA